MIWGFSDDSDDKESAFNAGNPGSIPGLRRSPEERNGYPLQCSCLERWLDSITDAKDMNLSKLWEMVTDRVAWHAAVHGVTESTESGTT